MLEGRIRDSVLMLLPPSLPVEREKGSQKNSRVTVEKGFWGSGLTSKKEFPLVSFGDHRLEKRNKVPVKFAIPLPRH